MLVFLSCISLFTHFRTCDEIRYCRENCDKTDYWILNQSSIVLQNNEIKAQIYSTLTNDVLVFHTYQIQTGGFRIRVEPNIRQNFRYDTSENMHVIDGKKIKTHSPLSFHQTENNIIAYGQNNVHINVSCDPFEVSLYENMILIFQFNKNQKLTFEQGTPIPNEQYCEDDDDSICYNDQFPNGATSVGIDLSFPSNQTRLTGFSQKLMGMNLVDNVPIRLFNMDQFPNYGSIPLVYAHRPYHQSSLFWINPSETWAFINSTDKSREIKMLSEGGYIDMILFTGPYHDLYRSYYEITGFPSFAPLFALGYHQSKWGYQTQEQVEEVERNLSESGIPFDSIWLDIDHLKDRAPFVFNETSFPDPNKMINYFGNHNRFIVRISDPHIPKFTNLKQYNELHDKKLYVQLPPNISQLNELPNQELEYNAECWPGISAWPDFLNPQTIEWYSKQYSYNAQISGPNVFYWNDMNEASVFSSPENTFPRYLLHTDQNGRKYENREIHSLYGLLHTASTQKGLIKRGEDHLRPFILTRSFFAGSQKYAWHWSGDNFASFDHLQKSLPMIITSGFTGMPFTGSDVGGYMCWGQPENEELLVRWFQTGAWCYVFFREHSDSTTPFREPYLYNDTIYSIIKQTITERYRFLPFWYTAMRRTTLTGIPLIQSLFLSFPDEEKAHDIEDQIIIDKKIMVAPVLEPGANIRNIYIPPGKWYDIRTGRELTNNTLNVNITSIPVFIKAGTIIPTFSEAGNTTIDTLFKPMHIIIALDSSGFAQGDLYLDDGRTMDYEKGDALNTSFMFSNSKLLINTQKPTTIHDEDIQYEKITITKITVYGAEKSPESINGSLFNEDSRHNFIVNGIALTLTIPYYVPKSNKGIFTMTTLIIVSGRFGLVALVAIIIGSVLFSKSKNEKSYLGMDEQALLKNHEPCSIDCT